MITLYDQGTIGLIGGNVVIIWISPWVVQLFLGSLKKTFAGLEVKHLRLITPRPSTVHHRFGKAEGLKWACRRHFDLSNTGVTNYIMAAVHYSVLVPERCGPIHTTKVSVVVTVYSCIHFGEHVNMLELTQSIMHVLHKAFSQAN